MPHKSGSMWRWGNVKRKSKEDLRRTVYGIWLKQGSKGSFKKFWQSGKLSEAEDDASMGSAVKLSFRKVERADVPGLLGEIEGYCESRRFRRGQFEKYLSSEKEIDRSEKLGMFYGCFGRDDGRCLALAYLNKVPSRCVLVSQVSCVVPGYGRALLEDILSRGKNVWLAADWASGEKLLAYYRSFGKLQEVALPSSKWANGRKQHFFIKASGAGLRKILAKISEAGCQANKQ